jgi:hypothetical protein
VVQIHSPRPLFLNQRFTPHENPKGAWSETKHSCIASVGRERSLSFEFIALQWGGLPSWESDSWEIRYKISPLGRKTKVVVQVLCSMSCQDAILLQRELWAIIRGNVYHSDFVGWGRRLSVSRGLIQVGYFRMAVIRLERSSRDHR